MENESSAGSTTETSSGNSEQTKETVSYETHKKLLGQRKSDQEKMRTLEARLTEFETNQKTAEEAKMAEQGEYKKMVDIKQQELTKVLEENHSIKKQITDTYKYNAFVDLLPGQLKSNDYLVHADLDSIAIDPESGKVDVDSVQSVVNSFMDSHSSLLKKNDVAKIPANASGATTQTKNPAQMTAEQKQERWNNAFKNLLTK